MAGETTARDAPSQRARIDIAVEPSAPTKDSEIFAAARALGHRHLNLHDTLAQAPAMHRAWCGLTWPLRDEPAVPRALRELAIMRIAALKDADYEWAHHWLMATASGVTPEKLRALESWESSDVFDDAERDVLRYADAMASGPSVPDEIYAPIAQRFSPAEVIELTLTISTYIGIAHFLGALQVEVEDGVIDELRAQEEEL